MTRETAIKTAAKWWADKLRSRAPHSNGDNALSSVFACMLADIGTEEATEDKLAVFTSELEHQIREHMDNVNGRYVWLGSDYGPCTMLGESADEAGINRLNFPFKTDMNIEQSSGYEYMIRVSDGYGQPWKNLDPCE